MKNCSFYVFYFLFSVLLISCNDKKENPGTLGEKELFFTERLSSISLDSDSAFWIGGETGEVWHVDKGEILPYNISSARIYKIATDAVGADTKSCWIGIRNSGLQKWEFGENVCRLVDRYAIRNKGYNYSVYDILLAGDNVYVATSQGLYAMSRSGKDSLNLIYPSADSETAYSGKPFIVNSIRSYGTGYVLCATQKGLIRINLIDGTIHSSHEEEAIYHVSVYDNKIYLLVDRKLYIEDIDGKVLSEFNLNFSSRIYYKLANIHYFLDETHLFLSENMEKFVSIPLRRKIPLFCNNVMATDKINGYTLLITENALWNIPLHSGILYVSGEIVASCTNGNDIYYVNSNNELFHQRIGSSDAVKVLDFLENEVVSDIMADEEYLYYISNKQILKRIKVGDRYLANSLFASSRVMYESPTKITASYLKRSSEGNSIYLGIQDNLVKINPTGKASLIESLDNKYITSFYAEENSANLYISTLNDGVYYGKDSLFHVIDGTENRTFIRDISAIEAYNPLLLILTNHHLISKEYNDSIPVKGYKKILKVNDTLFYALPEFGLAKYTIDKGKIHEHWTVFSGYTF